MRMYVRAIILKVESTRVFVTMSDIHDMMFEILKKFYQPKFII